MEPVRRLSTDGAVAPSTAIEQPSQLIPASQKTWTLSKGPSLVAAPVLAAMLLAHCSWLIPATLPARDIGLAAAATTMAHPPAAGRIRVNPVPEVRGAYPQRFRVISP